MFNFVSLLSFMLAMLRGEFFPPEIVHI